MKQKLLFAFALLSLVVAGCSYTANISNFQGQEGSTNSQIDGVTPRVIIVNGGKIDETKKSIWIPVMPEAESLPLENLIEVTSNCSWKLYRGMKQIEDKVAVTKSGSLAQGDNDFVIVVKSNDGNFESTYDLTVYRGFYAMLTYKLGQKTLKTDRVATGFEFFLPNASEITGYPFTYWVDAYGNNVTSIIPFELQVYYVYARASGKSCILNLDPAGGELDDRTVFVTFGEEYTLPTPTRYAYDFCGWYNGNDNYPLTGVWAWELEQEITLTARWSAIPYSITYEMNGGTNALNNPNSYTTEDIVSFDDPTRDGFEFDGWYSSNGTQVTSISRGSSGDITLQANWVQSGLVFVRNIGRSWSVRFASETDCPENVEIPPFYQGMKVKNIGDNAFFGCSSLKSITIPSSVVSIGSYAFTDCTSLSSITIPSSVISIGTCAFLYCSSLSSITIPSSVTSIGNHSFDSCTSLSSITIPSSVTSIGSKTFYGCTSLESITIPSSVISIGTCAFTDCTSLSSITIPSSVTSIGSYAFTDCTSLSSITIPSSVTSIGNYTFAGCTSLSSIAIPDSVASIGNGAFSGCTSLTSIIIPSSVTSVAVDAFNGCHSLTVYCESQSKPSGWNDSWNYCCAEHGYLPVIWGYHQ